MAERETNFTAVYKADISDLKAKLTESNKLLNKQKTEFEKTTAGMDDWKLSSDGLNAKLKQLSEGITTQNEKLSNYKKQLETTEKYVSENEIKANDLRAAMKKLADDGVSEAAEKYDKLQTELKKAESNLTNNKKKLKDIQEAMKELADDGISETSEEYQKLKLELSKTEKQISSFKKKTNDLKDEMKDLTNSGIGDSINKYKKLKTELVKTEKVITNNKKVVEDLTDKCDKQEITISKLEKEHRKFTKQLEKVEKAEEKVGKDAEKVAKELKDMQKAADKAEKELDDLGDEAKDTGEGFTTLKATIANFVANAISSMISAVGNAIEETREYRRELSFLEQNVKSAGKAMIDAEKNLKKVVAITEDSGAAVEGLSNLLITGFSQAGLDKMTEALLGASIKWKDTLKFESLSDSLAESLATKNATGPFAEMLERSGIVLDDFNVQFQNAIKTGKQEQFILQTLARLGLNDVYEGYVKANEGAIAYANATFDLQNNMAKLGETLEPIAAAFKQGFADLLGEMVTVLEGVDFKPLIADIKEVFKYLAIFIRFLIENKEAVMSTLIAIGTGLAVFKTAAFIEKLVIGIKAFAGALGAAKGIIAAVQAAMTALNITLFSTPIGLIVAAVVAGIAALVAGLMYLWKNCEGFRNFVKKMWKEVSSFVTTGVNGLVKLFTEVIPDAIGEAIKWFADLPEKIGYFFGVMFADIVNKCVKFAYEDIPNFIKAVIEWFAKLPENIGKLLFETIPKLITWGIEMVNKGREISRNIQKTILEEMIKLPGKVWDVGVNIVKGLWNGIKSMAGWIGGKIEQFCSGLITGFTDELDIHSPSRKAEKIIGVPLAQGVGVGLAKGMKSVNKMFGDLVKFPSISGSLTGLQHLSSIPSLGGSTTNNKTIIVNQTVTNPKTSQWEVYRATKNAVYALG